MWTYYVLIVIAITLYVKSQDEIDLNGIAGELCDRECEENPGSARLCYFSFVLEYYHAMGPACGNCSNGIMEDCFAPQCITADGIEMGVMAINRKVPGPKIAVCVNDFIVVDVKNSMAGSGSTIHWHGIYQNTTPYMDGVPFVTQCPIPGANTFRYAFPANQFGTYFYHSHTGYNKVNGHFGALVIRQPLQNDVNNIYYDYDLTEHIMVVADWIHETAELFVPGLPTRLPNLTPSSGLINGKGKFFDVMTNSTTKTPYERFYVEANNRYRFRLINSIARVCPVKLQIESHGMLIIATDGDNVEATPIDILISSSGERYDFVVDANQPEGDYWIRMTLNGICAIEQYAILSYGKGNVTRLPEDFVTNDLNKITLNNANATCFVEDSNEMCVSQLSSTSTDEALDLKFAAPDLSFFLVFDTPLIKNAFFFEPGTYRKFLDIEFNDTTSSTINNIAFVSPPFSLLTQSYEITDNLFCNKDSLPEDCSNKPVCECVHLLKIGLNSVVEMHLVDVAKEFLFVSHPIHIHGYSYAITNMWRDPTKTLTVEILQELIATGTLPKPPPSHVPPLKDTIQVPNNGIVTTKFRASNPGFWFFHCHFDWHLVGGMTLVLQVGEPEDMLQPSEPFPTCNNYEPALNSSFLSNFNTTS